VRRAGSVSPRAAEDIYNDALDLPPGERRAYVARECARDTALEREVLDLLAFAQGHPDLLDPLCPDEREVPEHLGKYRIIKEIGRGAMGRVYLAEDQVLGRRVALKLLPEHVAEAAGADWLRREAAILSRIEHPRIATLYTSEEHDGFRFMTMQYVTGRTLAERLADGPLPLAGALRIGLHIAQALERAHEKGVIHRDLKPLNVMITEDGGAKVLDFGIAMFKTAPAPLTAGALPRTPGNTGVSRFLGTPGYMSPEQLRGGPVDPRSDLWALGAILFECLTGSPPLRREAPEPPEPWPSPDWKALPRGVPSEVRRLLRRCLAARPDHRPAAAGEVRAELEAALRAVEGGPGNRGRRARVWLGVGGIVAVRAGGGRLLLKPSAPEPTQFVWLGSQGAYELAAQDASGREIWRLRPAEGRTFEPGQRRLSRTRRPALMRTTEGRQIVAVVSKGTVGNDRVLGLDGRTGRILWSREPQAELPPGGTEGRWAGLWQKCIQTGPGEEDLFLLGWAEGVHYPCALEFCRADGSVLATYYHPGMVFLWSQADMDGDGRPELLLYGENNSARETLEAMPPGARERLYNPAVLLVLDVPSGGQAYPVADWAGVPRAAEQAYVLIPPYTGDREATCSALSCSDDLRVLVTFADHRRLLLAPGLKPEGFEMAPWSDEWQAIKGRVRSFPVYTVAGEEPVRVDVPVNASLPRLEDTTGITR
jgi:tRNA A-37 threonylcarbamoyl transferase component Bud32